MKSPWILALLAALVLATAAAAAPAPAPDSKAPAQPAAAQPAPAPPPATEVQPAAPAPVPSGPAACMKEEQLDPAPATVKINDTPPPRVWLSCSPQCHTICQNYCQSRYGCDCLCFDTCHYNCIC